MVKTQGNHNHWFLGGICFLAYAACYSGRGILSAMIPQILQQTNLTKEALGRMGSAFFFSYGIGQLVNGFIGDFVKPKYMVSLGLLLAGLVSYGFLFFQSVALRSLLWGACGLFCSMLWGPLSKLIAENTTEKMGRLFMTLLTVASLLGTMATYIIAAIASSRESWEMAFRITGTFLIFTAIVWYMVLDVLEKSGSIRHMEHKEQGQREVFAINRGFVFMIIVSLLNGIIRNAVVFWIPTYITEKLGVSTTMAASISTILPVINLLGTFAAFWLLKRMKDNEKSVIAVLFILSTLMFTLMYLIDGKLFFTTLIALFLASAAMTGACNMIFSVYCLRFANTGRVSGITGFIDFTAYVAAAMASPAFTSLVAIRGWNATVASWAVISAAGGLFAYLAAQATSVRSSLMVGK
jgi:sugar phosphate permease